jgi:hypothetical protein
LPFGASSAKHFQVDEMDWQSCVVLQAVSLQVTGPPVELLEPPLDELVAPPELLLEELVEPLVDPLLELVAMQPAVFTAPPCLQV